MATRSNQIEPANNFYILWPFAWNSTAVKYARSISPTLKQGASLLIHFWIITTQLSPVSTCISTKCVDKGIRIRTCTIRRISNSFIIYCISNVSGNREWVSKKTLWNLDRDSGVTCTNEINPALSLDLYIVCRLLFYILHNFTPILF